MRIITLLLLILCNPIYSYSQPLLGFAAGINYSEIPYTHFYDHAKVDSKFSHTFGSTFEASIFKNLYYSIGITYNHLTAHITGYESSASHLTIEDLDLTLGYISLSILPEYSFGRKRIFFIKAGGYFSLLVNSKEMGYYSSRVINGDRHAGKTSNNARQDYEDIDYGLLAGTGFRLKISDNTYFVPQIGYNLGLYKYNLRGSNITAVHRSGLKSVFFLIGFDFRLGVPR